MTSFNNGDKKSIVYAKKGTHGKGNSSRFVTTWICVYVCVVVVVGGGGGDGCCVFF